MRGTPFLKENFTKGLNTIDSPYTIQDGETRDCMNVVSTERGAIKKRTGSTKFAEVAASELLSIGTVTVSGTTYMLAQAGKKLYSINSAAEVSDITDAEPITEGKRWSIVQAPKGTKKTGGPVYLVNGVDKPRFWAGTEKATKVELWVGESGETYYEDATSKEHVPNGKYMLYFGGRMWMAGMSDDTSAIRFSDTATIGEGGAQADPTAWLKENVVRFETADGKPITGMGIVGPYIVVFKERKTWVIHNITNGENRRISDTVGCIANRSIVETGQGTFFLTADQGVYMTNGSTVKEMSYNVRPTILAINPAQREFAAGAYFNNHYYLSFASGLSSVPNRTIDYDLILKSWWLHDLAGNQWALWEPTAGEPFLFTCPGKAKAGFVKCFVPGVYTDSTVNYTGNGVLGAWWLSPWEPFAYYIFRHRIKAPFLKKRVRQIFFNGSGQIIPAVFKNFSPGERQERAVVANEPETQPEVPVNFSATASKWGEGESIWGTGEQGWGGEKVVSEARIYAPGVAFVWGVGWGNNSAEPFEVDAYAYMVQFRKS